MDNVQRSFDIPACLAQARDETGIEESARKDRTYGVFEAM